MMRQLGVALLALAISAPVVCADIAPPKKDGKLAADTVEPWWTDSQAGWFGGGLGGTVGILGGVIGTLAGLGRARRFVLGLTLVMILFGVGSLIAGIAAVSSGQPYHVYYPLLLLGGICTLVFGLNFPAMKRRYEQAELQKMAALDA